MILRSLELEQFGKFRGQSFEFRRGMNLVVGPNEAGKSTLAEAIPAILFGSSKVDKLKPWGRNACSASLVLEGDGRTIEVRRNLMTDEVHLVERDDLYHVLVEFKGLVPARGRTADSERYYEVLNALFGFAEEDLFRATYFFGQRLHEWAGDELAGKLRCLIGGTANTDYTVVVDQLLDEHFTLTRENPWGRNKQRDRERELLQQQLAQLGQHPGTAEAPVEGETVIDDAFKLRAQIKSLEAALEHDREEYAKGVRYVERLRQKRSAVEATTAAAAVSADPAPPAEENPADPPAPTVSLKEQLVAAGLPPNLPSNLPEILQEAAAIRQELAEFQKPLAALLQREKQAPLVPWLMIGGAVMLMGSLAAAAWWFAYQPLAVAGLATLLSVAAVGWGGLRQRQRGQTLAEVEEEQNRLELKKAEVLSRQADLTDRCEALGLPTSAIDMVRLQKAVEKHRVLLEQFWQAGADPAAPAPVPSTSPAPEAPETPAAQPAAEVDADLAELEKRLADFAADLTRREQELEALRTQPVKEPSCPASADATFDGLQQSLQKVDRRIAVLRKAVDLLAAAVDSYGRTHMVGLVEEASRLFGKMTGGRYRAIRFDDEMSPQIQVDQKRWQPADQFSRGTIDALYLALRVALTRIRGDGRCLPLLLDDPFVHLDHGRQAAALNLVDLAAAEGQIILLSHNQDLAKRAAKERWHVIPLGDEAAVSDEEEGTAHAGQLHLL